MTETTIELKKIEEELAEIHSLLQRLPEAQAAKLHGKTLRDIWTTATPDQR